MDADERLSAVIGEVYDASLDPALWSHVLETVCGYIGCSGAAFHSQDLLSHTANLQLYWGCDKYFADAYQDKYCKINPIFSWYTFFCSKRDLHYSRLSAVRGVRTHTVFSRMVETSGICGWP